MKQVFILLFVVSFHFCLAQAPAGKVSITILNAQSQPLSNATVELLHNKDSTLVKSTITDNNGVAELINIKPGDYLLRATFSGFHVQYTHAFSITPDKSILTIPSLIMIQDTARQLKGVTVSATKPFIQRLVDRIVVNVDGSIISAGSSALDVLERSPKVTIDQETISLSGRPGVLIMIDGKPTAMNGADLTNYLRGLPSSVIDRIEIITNPSAKYEAAGNAGIIDIRLKKDQKLGMNGSLTLGYGQGVYPKMNSGMNFNYRNKKINIFGSYNYSYRKDLNDLIHERTFYKDSKPIGSDKKDRYSSFSYNNHTTRVGADFFPSKNTIVGFVFNGSFNKNHSNSKGHSSNYDPFNQPLYYFNTVTNNNSHSENTVLNVNAKQSFKNKRELTADIDYAVFNSKGLSRNTNVFYELNGSQHVPDILDGDGEGRLTLKAAKIDYTHPIQQKKKLEMGARSSYVSSDNNSQFFNVYPGSVEVDVTKSNRFYYNEYNHAGYINFNKESEKFSMQFGLRGEQTNISTEQVVGKISWDSAYFQVFPSAFLNYRISKERSLGFSVSRRIGRPAYSQLNPFLSLTDATTYSTGNPQLLPQLTWNYQMNYTVKNFNFTAQVSRNKDPQVLVIARLLDIIPNFPIDPSADSNISIERPVNLIRSTNYSFNIYAPFKVTPRWNMINNIDVLYNYFSAQIGGAKLNTGTPSIYIRHNNSFTFKKGWSAELNANYFSGRRSGYALFDPQWAIAAGAQKIILKGKGTIRFNVTDIFLTSVFRFGATYEGAYKDKGRARRETRVANLHFTYRFGNNKVQAERKRITASEEERKRAG